MKTKLYLHIGMNKTGSSAIQRFCAMNRECLSANGVLYPRTGNVGNAHYTMSSLLGFVQGKQKPVDLMSKPLLELSYSLTKEIDSFPINSVVISSEYFVLPKSVEIAKRFFADYDVKVVLYLRRHDTWWLSAYNQAVRTVVNPPWGPDFSSYLNFFETKRPGVGDYRLLLDRWAATFGKENIIVRPYESQQNKPAIEVDFLRSIGNEELVDVVEFDNLRINHSVGMYTLSLIDSFQRSKIDPDIRTSLINYALANRTVPDVTGVIDPELLRMLAKKHQKDYAYIAREYLGRDDGRLFYDPLPDSSSPWSKFTPPTVDEVVEIVVEVLGESHKVDVTAR